MFSFEGNKIFAALLTVGITLMLTGFIANQFFPSRTLSADAVPIEGGEDGGGHGASAPAKPALPDPVMALLADADAERGAKISKACAACHSFEKGGPVKQGPNLWSVINRHKAAVSGFAYSDALAAVGGVWDYDALNHFLEKPKKYVPGTKMNFVGLKKVADRAALIAWLRQQADSPAALPTPEQIQAEAQAFAPPEEEAVVEAPVEEDTSAH